METVWTETSITTFEETIEYINNKWSKKEAEVFYNKTMQVVEGITV
jgi:hypothetical protein